MLMKKFNNKSLLVLNKKIINCDSCERLLEFRKKIAREKIHNPIEIDNNKSDYPKMIIDEKLARKEAAKKIFSIRKLIGHKEEAKRIYNKHGSRKSGLKKTTIPLQKRSKIVKQKSLF